ncbi:hypothetical protein, partial [Fictibacillus sp. NRS-1165]|uniref:hypothetical protein n=1 Tax=Fictibacillus sp. NRS-1165 TaxID=3144463 RepID=UPI003D2286CE
TLRCIIRISLITQTSAGPKTLAKLAEILKKKKVTTNPLPKPKVTPKPKKTIHRVIGHREQINAFGDTENLLASVENQIKSDAEKIEIERV